MDREKLIKEAEKELVRKFYEDIERLNEAGLDYKAIAKGLGRSLITLYRWKQKGAFAKNGVTVQVARELNPRMRKMVECTQKMGLFDNA